MSLRMQERIVADIEQLQTYVDLGGGAVSGSMLLADVWEIDPYENGGTTSGTFSNGEAPDNAAIVYFTSGPDEDPAVQRAAVPRTAESFALGALKVRSRRNLAL